MVRAQRRSADSSYPVGAHPDPASATDKTLVADITAAVLRDRSPGTRARGGYIAEVCGATAHADATAELGVGCAGPYYTGRSHANGAYASRWRVYDTGRIA